MAGLLIADDHKLLLEVLSPYLIESLEGVEVECVTTLDELQKQLDGERVFELAIVDYRMPGSQGLATIRALVANKHGVPVAVMSGLATSSEVIQMLDAGIIGFLPKTVSGSSMTHAIRLMLSGERYIPASMFSSAGLVRPASTGEDTSEPLAEKEMRVLRLLRQGHTNKEIGRRLGIEEVTVKVYVSRLSKRFGVHNRVQVLFAAIERGLID